MKKTPSFLAALLLVLSGCASFEVQQTSRFVNDNGEFLEVDYCRGDDEHENDFYVPATGKTLEFKSKLRVRVRLENDSFKAFERMNLFRNGTLYESSDKEWLFHAAGFTCQVWRKKEDTGGKSSRPSYTCVFAGVLSQVPREPE